VERLYEAAKDEDPAALVTYVNYPSTEYLQLPFLDLVAFNVYLESPRRFAAYLARLQTIAGDRPLVLAELGLDSRRHGLGAQASALDWQIRTAFAGGCAGAFVFAWTADESRPRFTVAICSHNGAATLRACLERTLELEYPDFEVIVVDDGSADETPAIATSLGVRVVSTPNRGLSAARNTALELATGEIVVYLDDDAWPDRHWLTYLARAFRATTHAVIGGPNVPPPPRNLAERAIAAAPGG